MRPGVTVEPRHVAMWARAAAYTVPSKTQRPPTYSAWHRQRNGKRELVVEPVEAEQEIEGLAVQP